jgi:hypothetical protein
MMDLEAAREAMVAAELEAIPEPRPGYRGGWWMDGRKYRSRTQAYLARFALATQRADFRIEENARADREHAAYAARGMEPATTAVLAPGDVYSIPARRPPFAYHEYVVASVERLGNGASVVRHERQTDDPDEQSCLLHTSDLFLYRRPAGA